MVSQDRPGTSEDPPRIMMSKADKRLGYERTEPLQPTKVQPYVSPYKQQKPMMIAKKRGTHGNGSKGSPPKSDFGTGDTAVSGATRASSVIRNASVDELMARLASLRSETITEPEDRIHLHESKSAPNAKLRPPRLLHAMNDNAKDDDDSSCGTFSSLGGSSTSLGSMSVMSKVSISGKRYRSVQVEVEHPTGGRVRVVEYTMRNMIGEISSRAMMRDAPPPAFVPALEELPMTMISWNGRDNFQAALAMKKRSAAAAARSQQSLKNAVAAAGGRLPSLGESDGSASSPRAGGVTAAVASRRSPQPAKSTSALISRGGEREIVKTAEVERRERSERELDSFTRIVDEEEGFHLNDADDFSDSSLGNQSNDLRGNGRDPWAGLADHSKKRALGMRVDIIGMYQNIPLILARADERCRKQAAVLAAKQGITEERRKNLMARIAFNMSRSERYAEVLRVQQLQTVWLKVIKALIFQSHLQRVRGVVQARLSANKERVWAATTLAFAMQKYIRNRFKNRIANEFMHKIKSSWWVLQCAIRCHRKRTALKRIKFFLSLFQGKNRIKEVVHRFVRSALLIQRNVRNFVYCTRARIAVVGRLWERLELQYIEEVLAKRKADELKSGIAAKKLSKAQSGKKEVPLVDEKTRLEMEKQAKRWADQDARMEELLDKHRKTGLIVKETLRGNAVQLLLPESLKNSLIFKHIANKRKEFMLKVQMDAIAHAKQRDLFKNDDAHDMLYGHNEKIDLTIRAKYDASLNWFRSASVNFNIFKYSDQERRRGLDLASHLLEVIKDSHERAGTFVVKIRTAKKSAAGFDMAAHRKKAAAAAAAKEGGVGGSRPDTRSSMLSRPGTSSEAAGRK
jgi:hypothetical protein